MARSKSSVTEQNGAVDTSLSGKAIKQQLAYIFIFYKTAIVREFRKIVVIVFDVGRHGRNEVYKDAPGRQQFLQSNIYAIKET